MADDWYTALNKIYEVRRTFTYELADALGCTYDLNAVGLFVWAELPEGVTDAEAFIEALLHEKDLFITPGTIFGAGGAGYVRFSLCVDASLIQEAIKRLKN